MGEGAGAPTCPAVALPILLVVRDYCYHEIWVYSYHTVFKDRQLSARILRCRDSFGVAATTTRSLCSLIFSYLSGLIPLRSAGCRGVGNASIIRNSARPGATLFACTIPYLRLLPVPYIKFPDFSSLFPWSTSPKLRSLIGCLSNSIVFRTVAPCSARQGGGQDAWTQS